MRSGLDAQLAARLKKAQVARNSDEAVLLRPPACAGPVPDAELPVDVRQVELDRLLGHPQGLRDLRVRPPLGSEAKDLDLAPGETGSRGLRHVRRAPVRPRGWQVHRVEQQNVEG